MGNSFAGADYNI